MSSKAGKRPLRSLTAHEKLEAIRRVHDGESKASVARDIGVPESTLRGWCKNEDKISYLSRQSSPETDETAAAAAEPKEKRMRPDDTLQPFNLSKRGSRSPDFEGAKGPAKASPPMTERERNRAELARLSLELGLNRPEMFLNMNSGLAELGGHAGLLAQWGIMMHHKGQGAKVTAPADTSGYHASPKAEPEHKQKPSKPPRLEKPAPLDESLCYWLKTQPSMLGLMQSQNGLPAVAAVSGAASAPAVTSSSNAYGAEPPADQNSSWFWKWYKQFTSSYPLQQQLLPDKPILYQQLTKDKDSYDSENINGDERPAAAAAKGNIKARAVLDNLLFNNNNNNNLTVSKRDVRDEVLSQHEALEHGEKFLEWLECCGEPSVTAVQIMQFRYLLNNIRNGADRKNGDSQSRAKVKRK